MLYVDVDAQSGILNMSIAAYKDNIKKTSAPRDIEHKVLSQVTRSLENVSKEFNKNNRKNKILSNEVKNAVWENQQLWIALKSDLIMEGNALPDETKAALISLSIWIDKQSWNVIKGEGEITPLIDVNKRIIAGLQGQAV